MRVTIARPGFAPHLLLEDEAIVTVAPRGLWTHITVTTASTRDDGDLPLLTLTLRGEEAVYLRSSVPNAAGLFGGTYDPPSASIGPRLRHRDLDAAG